MGHVNRETMLKSMHLQIGTWKTQVSQTFMYVFQFFIIYFVFKSRTYMVSASTYRLLTVKFIGGLIWLELVSNYEI